MKIQCDVCNREEASVFCSADEAALCDGCDRRVHHANKLAGKHLRFSLVHPSIHDSPRCDICQERRASLFCREDRAILCRDCDLPIHTANDLTRKHSRFLLTGVKLSSSSPSPSTAAAHCPLQLVKKNKTKKPDFPSPSTFEKAAVEESNKDPRNEEICTSSISEYLIKTLPGWHVEDLLGSSSPPSDCLSKTDDLFQFVEAELDGDFGIVSEDLPMWVPQVQDPLYPAATLDWENEIGYKNLNEADSSRAGRRRTDDVFTVPQMINPSNKRLRTLC